MPQRKSGEMSSSLSAHLVAVASCITLLTLVPIVFYGLLMIVGLVAFGDAGGWLNVALVPLICFTAAVLCAGLLFPLAMLLQWLRSRWGFPAWLPLAAAYPVAFALISGIMIVHRAGLANAPELVGVALISLFVSCGFWAYWAPLMAFEAILELLRRPRTR
jgi:hypothetical protein